MMRGCVGLFTFLPPVFLPPTRKEAVLRLGAFFFFFAVRNGGGGKGACSRHVFDVANLVVPFGEEGLHGSGRQERKDSGGWNGD